MAKFVDKDGGEWYPEIRFSTLSAVKKKLGIDALPQNKEDAESRLTEKVRDNPELIPGILAVACDTDSEEEQKEAERAFDRGPLPDVINCFNQAWSDFLGRDITEESEESPTEAGTDD